MEKTDFPADKNKKKKKILNDHLVRNLFDPLSKSPTVSTNDKDSKNHTHSNEVPSETQSLLTTALSKLSQETFTPAGPNHQLNTQKILSEVAAKSSKIKTPNTETPKAERSAKPKIYKSASTFLFWLTLGAAVLLISYQTLLYFDLNAKIHTLHYSLKLKNQRLGSVQAKLNAQQTEIKRTTQLIETRQQEADRLKAALLFLNQGLRSGSSLTKKLDDLTSLIPEGVWLRGVEMANHKLIIKAYGLDKNVALELQKSLNQSIYFKNAKVRSAQNVNTDNGTVHSFEMEADAFL